MNGSAPTSSTKLGGFYKYTVDSDGYYRLTYIDGTSGDGYDDAYVDEKNVYFKATSMDELKNGILTFNTDETAAARDAAVVDVTDLDAKEDEDGYNSYGKSVTSVSALERLMDNDYTVTAELFINKDNEVVAIFITKVTGGGSISESGDDGKENESQYGLLKTSGGDITVEINGRTLSLKNAKVVDTANGNKNVDFKEMDVSIKIERKSDSVQTGYVDETTITGPSVSSKGAVTGQESVIGAGNYEATLGYELSEGSYRVTFTFTGDVVGTITYVAPTLITIS